LIAKIIQDRAGGYEFSTLFNIEGCLAVATQQLIIRIAPIQMGPYYLCRKSWS